MNSEITFGEEVKLFIEAVPVCVAALCANHNGDVNAAGAEVKKLVESITGLLEDKNLALVITSLRSVLVGSMLELCEEYPETEEPAESAKDWVN